MHHAAKNRGPHGIPTREQNPRRGVHDLEPRLREHRELCGASGRRVGQADHPISINTDDKLFFRSGASEEHFVFAQQCDRTREQLFELTEMAIEQTFLEEASKQRLRDLVAKRRSEMLSPSS